MTRFLLSSALSLGACLVISCGNGSAKPMDKVTFNCDTDEECANLPPCKLKAQAFAQGRAASGCDGGPNTQPFRLVGYDCVGHKTPIYRDEEDEFPICGTIEGIWE